MTNRQRRVVEFVIERALFLCAAVSVLVTAGIIFVLLFETMAFLREVSIVEFLTGTEWTPLFSEKHFGVLPLVAGTTLVSAIAMVVALPAGLLAAIYLSEYAPSRLRRVVKPVLEVLAGIPTVVYGYFALLFVTPLLQRFIPTLSGFNALGPGIVMGIMILPLGLLPVRRRPPFGAERPARGRLRAGRNTHAGHVACGRAGRLLGYLCLIHPGGVARDWRDDDRGRRRRAATPADG